MSSTLPCEPEFSPGLAKVAIIVVSEGRVLCPDVVRKRTNHPPLAWQSVSPHVKKRARSRTPTAPAGITSSLHLHAPLCFLLGALPAPPYSPGTYALDTIRAVEVESLIEMLPNVVLAIREAEYEHLDTMWADSAKDRVFPRVSVGDAGQTHGAPKRG